MKKLFPAARTALYGLLKRMSLIAEVFTLAYTVAKKPVVDLLVIAVLYYLNSLLTNTRICL
jgi:type III secretory pathway component EscT